MDDVRTKTADDRKKIAEALQAGRNLAGITQQELGEIAKMSPASICKIETGAVRPHKGSIKKITEALAGLGVEIVNQRDWVGAVKQR
jgi:predicted transcriptional regulator